LALCLAKHFARLHGAGAIQNMVEDIRPLIADSAYTV
jgi:hypothetical protein